MHFTSNYNNRFTITQRTCTYIAAAFSLGNVQNVCTENSNVQRQSQRSITFWTTPNNVHHHHHHHRTWLCRQNVHTKTNEDKIIIMYMSLRTNSWMVLSLKEISLCTVVWEWKMSQNIDEEIKYLVSYASKSTNFWYER